MVYKDCRILGPHIRPNGRKFVEIIYPDGKRKGMSWPKFVMENRIGRYLTKDETVDHINGDFLDNRPKNLRVMERAQHAKEDIRRLKPQEFECPECKKQFTRSGKRLSWAISGRKRGYAGPFCGLSCAAKDSNKVKRGRPKLKVKQIIPEYTTLKEMIGIKKKKGK